MQLPYSEKLNIEKLGRLFDNKSECYKLFWFKAIMSKIASGQFQMTYEELIDEMIADAWYMVTEYHLNLGPNDSLEKVVSRIKDINGFASSMKRQELLEYLDLCMDTDVIKLKKVLTLNVPYRLQSPLLSDFVTASWNMKPSSLAQVINQRDGLIYYFENISGLQSRIRINAEWSDYLYHNQEIIKGWIDYNLIIYLQRRNPSVPGISDKLYPPVARKLEKVKKYWKCVAEISGEIHEIYGDTLLNINDISIDHFVPWSYVAHDEFWNLHPTTCSINSSKRNNLPKWEVYFHKLAEIEYRAYCIAYQNDIAKSLFMICSREHLNNTDIAQRLYRDGQTQIEFENQLNEIISPIYLAAKNSGFSEWVYG